SELASLEGRPLGLVPLATDGPGLVVATRQGVVKRIKPEVLSRESWPIIALADGDEVVGVASLCTGDETLAFITSDANLLHFGVDKVNAQGRSGRGIAGIKLASGQHVVAFGVVRDPGGAH